MKNPPDAIEPVDPALISAGLEWATEARLDPSDTLDAQTVSERSVRVRLVRHRVGFGPAFVIARRPEGEPSS
jgi:hypothetical protein